MKKRIVLLVSILFYAGMLLLTFSARKLHRAELPHVEVFEIGYELFRYEDGNNFFDSALPKELYQDGEIYKIIYTVINNEVRTAAMRVDILIGTENENFYQLKNGVRAGERIIVSGLDRVTDGCEVYIVEEGGQKKDEK